MQSLLTTCRFVSLCCRFRPGLGQATAACKIDIYQQYRELYCSDIYFERDANIATTTVPLILLNLFLDLLNEANLTYSHVIEGG